MTLLQGRCCEMDALNFARRDAVHKTFEMLMWINKALQKRLGMALKWYSSMCDSISQVQFKRIFENK